MDATRVRQLGQAVTALSVALIAYGTLAPNLSVGSGGTEWIHFFLFLPLGAGGALWAASLAPRVQRRARLGVFVAILAFAAATELAQGPIDGRTPSFPDFIADALGAGVGVIAGGWIAHRAGRNAP